ncbi:MAG: hypothetical protein ACM3SP_26005 [Chloroflexota bacterium]
MKAAKAVQKQSAPLPRVNVKLTGDSDLSRGQTILSRLQGVQSVIQTFPDEPDEDLKRLFVLEIEPSKLESVLKELRRRGEVEYAERAPLRKLIR